MAVDDDIRPVLHEIRSRYSELTVLRAAVQAVPYVGGPLDTLLVGGIAVYQLRRVEDFVSELQDRMSRVEAVAADVHSEGFADFVVATLDRVIRARTHAKRSRFAAIFSRQVASGADWEDAETAVRLLAELEDIHIDILKEALPADRGAELEPRVADLLPTDQAGVITVTHLAGDLPQYQPVILRMACAELAARGLLVDYGVNRLNDRAMSSFVATDLARWFKSWLQDVA